MVVAVQELGFVVCEIVLEDGGADFFSQADNKTKVVNGGEVIVFLFLFNIARAPKSAEAATGPAGVAGCAVTTRIKDGARVGKLTKIKRAVASVNFAVAGLTSRSDAVESVGTHFGANENVVRVREAE